MKLLTAVVRPEIRQLQAYQSARSENVTGDIWLDANENPWDSGYNRYPEPQPSLLITKLANLYQVDQTQLLVTRGSDEAIDLLIRLCCQAGSDHILICPPTYGMYQVAANIQHAHVIKVPLIKAQNFALDSTAILAHWQPTVKLIFLCSPNNPTGNLLDENAIVTLLTACTDKTLVVIDEAYIEFAARASMTHYLKHHDNLVILRTLSKAYGLAGIRCGSVLAHPEIIQLLKKTIAPYPIAQPVTEIVLQQLNQDKVKKAVAIIQAQRQQLITFLRQLPSITTVWDSAANFILVESLDYQLLLDRCRARGIILRDRHRDAQLANCIRLTVGTPEQNQLLQEVMSGA